MSTAAVTIALDVRTATDVVTLHALDLDVTSARAIRGFVKEWIREKPGRTLLLTTHYMAEADELCDRLAIVDPGTGKRSEIATPCGAAKAIEIRSGITDTQNVETISVRPQHRGSAAEPPARPQPGRQRRP